MELIEKEKNDNILNIKEKFQFYLRYIHDKLTDEQKILKEITSRNSMFDLVASYTNVP